MAKKTQKNKKPPTVTDFIFWAPKSLHTVTAAMELKDAWKKSYDKPRVLKSGDIHYFADKGPYNQSYGFSSSHVWVRELHHKES